MLNSQNTFVGPVLCFIALLTPDERLCAGCGRGEDFTRSLRSPIPRSTNSTVFWRRSSRRRKAFNPIWAKTRIEKWKTDASSKQQTLTNVQSIQRNLQSALPEIIAQLNNAPEDTGVSFKLYRNLDALYDVFSSVVESAGAFGSKDEFKSLGNDMTALETARRTFGERVQKLAAGKEEELTRLRAQVKTLSAAPPPPPKKIVVDDTEPAKKPAAKKKATKPKTPAATTDTPPQ
jgi:hypothetical protein